jgi:hypothetical protein
LIGAAAVTRMQVTMLTKSNTKAQAREPAIPDTMSWLRLASFATLVNQKVVVLSKGSDYVALDWHFFTRSLMPLIGRIRLDADWYLATYPDVKEAIANNVVADAADHYLRYGYFEHRIPYRIKVEEKWYLEQYPDVKEAIASRTFWSGQEHFELNGYREGRIPYPNFELAVA